MKPICRLLIALMIWAPYPFATAGMIPTEQTGAIIERAALVYELQAYGVDPASAQARVAALTDREAHALAAEIASAPAGGVYAEGIITLVIISLLIYAWYKHRNPW